MSFTSSHSVRNISLLLGLLTMVCSLPAASPYRETVAPDTVQGDLKGPVKTVYEKTYKVSKEGGRTLSEERHTTYDAEGYKLEELTVDVESNTRSIERRIYDQAGNLIQIKTDEGKGSVEVEAIETDAAHHLVKYLRPRGSKPPLLLREVSYEAFHKEAGSREFDGKGRIGKTVKVTRDSRGNETEILFMDAKGRVQNRLTLTWDARGINTVWLAESKKDSSTIEVKSDARLLDSTGNWTELMTTTQFAGPEIPSHEQQLVREITYHVGETK
jgi:hypothetical protein